MADQESPFIPGARVALYTERSHYGPHGYREDFVLKSHKTGRFTLRGDPKQQWSPSRPSGDLKKYWSGTQTGNHGWNGGGSLRLWDEAADEEIKATIAKHARFKKFRKLQAEVERIQFTDLVTQEMVDQFEVVVLGIKPIPKDAPK